MAGIDIAIGGERVTDDRSVAEVCRSAQGRYVIAVVRGVTKPELIEQVSIALDGVDPEDIISISYHADWPFFLWRRNSALIVLKPG